MLTTIVSAQLNVKIAGRATTSRGATMPPVIHRGPRAKLPVAVRGEGIEIVDSTGKRYIDTCGGAAVSCLGHSHARVIEAIQRQVQQLPYAHTSFFTTEPAEEL